MLAGGEVDHPERVEDRLVVAAQPPGRLGVRDGALHVAELKADARYVELRRRVFRVYGDQHLEPLPGLGEALLAKRDHREPELRLGERGVAEIFSGLNSVRIRALRVVEPIELEERFA